MYLFQIKEITLVLFSRAFQGAGLVRSTSDRAVRVRALAGDIVLCSQARHFTLTVSLSTQVYEWVPPYF